MARPKKVDTTEHYNENSAEDLMELDKVFNVEQTTDQLEFPPAGSRPLESAILYHALFVPGLPAETSLNQAKIPGIKIWWYGKEQTLYGIARGKKFMLCTAVASMVPK